MKQVGTFIQAGKKMRRTELLDVQESHNQEAHNMGTPTTKISYSWMKTMPHVYKGGACPQCESVLEFEQLEFEDGGGFDYTDSMTSNHFYIRTPEQKAELEATREKMKNSWRETVDKINLKRKKNEAVFEY